MEILVIVIFIIVIFAFSASLVSGKQRKKPSRLYNYYQTFSNSDKRLAAIDSAIFELYPVLNKGEFYAYQRMRKLIDDRGLDLLIFPQIPLISYIKERSTASSVRHIQRGIRPDFTLFDSLGKAILAVEINGTGHHAKNDVAQEKVLRKVGVTMLTVDTTGWHRRNSVSYKDHVISCVEKVFVQYLDEHR